MNYAISYPELRHDAFPKLVGRAARLGDRLLVEAYDGIHGFTAGASSAAWLGVTVSYRLANRSIQHRAPSLALAAALLALTLGGCTREASEERSGASGVTKRDHRKVIGAGELYFHTQTYSPEAPYFLYLNGGPGDVSIRGRAAFEASGLGRNIIYLDQRGCGRSARDVPENAFRFANLVADIDGVLDALGLNKVILLGHSWGATYGLQYAISRPERVIALLAMSPVDSWKRALDRYYTAAPAYARRHIELLTTMRSGRTLTEDEGVSVRQFCAFMHKHHKDEASVYARCADDPTTIKAGADSVIAELRADLDALATHRDAKNRWPGWSARGIRKKYGLYRYSPVCNDVCARAEQLTRQIYTTDELRYSERMEKGLWVNEDWGDYDALRELPKLRGEYFYLYGAHDALFGSSELAALVEKRYGSDHVVRFARSGHSPATESPVELTRVLHQLYTRLTTN